MPRASPRKAETEVQDCREREPEVPQTFPERLEPVPAQPPRRLMQHGPNLTHGPPPARAQAPPAPGYAHVDLEALGNQMLLAGWPVARRRHAEEGRRTPVVQGVEPRLRLAGVGVEEATAVAEQQQPMAGVALPEFRQGPALQRVSLRCAIAGIAVEVIDATAQEGVRQVLLRVTGENAPLSRPDPKNPSRLPTPGTFPLPTAAAPPRPRPHCTSVARDGAPDRSKEPVVSDPRRSAARGPDAWGRRIRATPPAQPAALTDAPGPAPAVLPRRVHDA